MLTLEGNSLDITIASHKTVKDLRELVSEKSGISELHFEIWLNSKYVALTKTLSTLTGDFSMHAHQKQHPSVSAKSKLNRGKTKFSKVFRVGLNRQGIVGFSLTEVF